MKPIVVSDRDMYLAFVSSIHLTEGAVGVEDLFQALPHKSKMDVRNNNREDMSLIGSSL